MNKITKKAPKIKKINEVTSKNSKANPNDILRIAGIVLTILAHIGIIALVILSYKYYNIEFKVFVGIVGIIGCLLVITDIILYVASKYKGLGYKIANVILALLLFIIGAGGSYYVGKINKAVNNVIENDGVEQYETIAGVFTYYTKSSTGKTFTSLDDLKNASNVKVGVIVDDGVGTGSLAKEILSENNIEVTYVTYNTSEDLLSGLVGTQEDENVDIAVFPSSYRTRWLNDTESGDAYADYLENMVDFYTFEEKMKTGDNENANRDLTVEPFNILLIGFAPESEDMTVGLADTIIVATVNPETFTVSLTSVARDTYTYTACKTDVREKINAARGVSRQCLMDTVGNLLDLDIDYYMEVNFQGVVEIVDAIGGIVIDNDVEFVGETSSVTRGEKTVWVPAGTGMQVNGEQALAFARERYAYADGDFARQKHQQQVIARIAEKLLSMSNVNQALAVMEAAGNNMSTNLSLDQLTNIFNYLINHNNATGITTFEMIDIQNLRLTGYGSNYYSYSMRLVQWIYRLYEGSIKETKARINDVLGNYATSDIEQVSYLKFFAESPYERGQLYSTYFDEVEVHEEMPAYYPSLTKMTYSEALAWASANGVTLEVSFIDNASEGYDASQDGMVTSQYPRSGALVEEYPTGSITVMGNQSADYVAEYTFDGCDSEEACKVWASKYGITTSTETKYDTSQSEGAFAGTNYNAGDKIKKTDTLIIYKYTSQSSSTTATIPSFGSEDYNSYKAKLTALGFTNVMNTTTTTNTSSNNGLVASVTPGVGSSVSTSTTINVVTYVYSEQKVTMPSYTSGSTKYSSFVDQLTSAGFKNVSGSAQANTDSSKNGIIITVSVGGSTASPGATYSPTSSVVITYYADATVTDCGDGNHTDPGEHSNVVEATCDAAGSYTYVCSKCGKTVTVTVDKLSGDSCTVTPAPDPTPSEGGGDASEAKTNPDPIDEGEKSEE